MSVKFIIVGAPRTGSTLLVRTLNSLNGICCHGELLGPDNVRGYEDGFDLLSASKSERDDRASRLVEERNQNPAAFMQKALTTKHTATGFKALYSSFANPRWRQVTNALLEGKEIRFVHLTRNNSLRRYTSEQVFQAGGANHSAEGGRADKRVTVAIDIDAYLARCAEIDSESRELTGRLAGQAVLDISYEALGADTGATVSHVCQFLGMNIAPSAIVPALQKVGAPDLRNAVSNYQELLDHEATRALALSD